MIPTNSSGSTNGCDNISSNCVVWQGPDIACIDLCSGDTISDVTFKLATKVCDLITNGVTSNPSLAGLDLTCLNIAGQTPTALVPVLQSMVTQICLNNTTTASKSSTTLPIMALPACLQYNDSLGNPVTQLRLDLFATLIAEQVCTNLSSIAVINSTLTSYNSRLNILEACVLPCSGVVVEKQVIPTCIINVGQLTDVSVLLLALEVRFCSLETAVGLPAAINLAIGQPTIQGSTTTLTTPSVSYSGLSGWNNSPSTLAQSVQNSWVIIDDIYTAIAAIQTNCCPTGCDSVTFAYTTTNLLNVGNGLINGLNFNFTGSSIPNSFNDVSGFSKITITDADGLSVNTTVSVSTLQNDPAGFIFNVPTLNTVGGLSVTVNFGVSDGTSTCQDDQSTVVDGIINCPNVTMGSTTSSGTTVSFTNVYGATAVFVIDILDVTGTLIQQTYTQNNPTANVSHAFTGLVANTIYNARVTLTYGGVTEVCSLTQWNTASAAAACNTGMDVAFIIDYTGSMSSEIGIIQSGIASVISTIVAESGSSDYRLGLALADENTANTTTYSTSVDYVALPAAQKLIVPGNAGNWSFITGVEMFQTNNSASFQTQLAKINTGAPTPGWPLGTGAPGGPEPTDLTLSYIVSPLALLNTFRPNVANYALIYTDALPGGTSGVYDLNTVASMNSLLIACNTAGIKVFVFGAGVDISSSITGTTLFPWREFASATGGIYSSSYDSATVAASIVNGCA
jgi:hypothetical protein